MKRIISVIMAMLLMCLTFCGCDIKGEKIEIQVFIAASLLKPMEEIAAEYEKLHPQIHIVYNADSSGKLMTQIREGYACDIFFSADTDNMDRLMEEGLLVESSRTNVVNNHLVVISQKNSGSRVIGLNNIEKADSIALAGSSVSAGKYTRQALINMGILTLSDDKTEASDFTTKEVSEQLCGVEISEQDNVTKVVTAVVEGSCEVGTAYLSDTYGLEDELDILEIVPTELTGSITYPIACVNNPESTENIREISADFVQFILSDKAKSIFEKYYFDT